MKPEDKIFLARIFVTTYQSQTTYYRNRQTIKLKLLGILAGIIALPLIIFLVLISFVVPRKQWEEFWDNFLEL